LSMFPLRYLFLSTAKLGIMLCVIYSLRGILLPNVSVEASLSKIFLHFTICVFLQN